MSETGTQIRLHQFTLGKILLAISILLFAASLGLQCYYCEGESPDWSFGSDSILGMNLLVLGWMGVLLTYEFAWLANPCYAVAMTFVMGGHQAQSKFEKSGTQPDPSPRSLLISAAIFSLGATLFSLTFLFQSSTYMGSGAAGSIFRIIGYGPGYYLWVAAMLTQLVGLSIEIYHGPRVHSIQNRKSAETIDALSATTESNQ